MMTEQAKVPAIRFAGFTDPWEQRKLGEIADKVTEKNLDGNITEVLTNSAEYGVINQTEFFDHAVAKESNIAGYYVIAPGDFVYNPRISATAPVGPIRRNTLGIHGVMSPLYTVFRLTDAVDGTYLSHFFKTNGWHGFMKLEGNSGARSDRFSIGDATFFEMPIPVPSSSEQHAIGSFFSRLDDLITLHQRKYDKLVIFKKSMLEKMFPKDGESVPEIRFAGFTDPWEQRKLGDIAERVTRKNENNESDLPLTISAQHGLIDQRLFFNAQVASRDMSGYYLLRQGEFAYNKSTSADSPWGAIKRLTRYEKGCVSTLYICFALLNANPDYLVTYYETNRWHKAVQMIAAEGARNHGLLNIAPDDFFDTMVSLPESQAEQQTIGAFFSRLDSLITLHQRKLELLQNIKKSLLDKMFV
nr:restriction endonuclease subunit S [Bifidobacterium longum]